MIIPERVAQEERFAKVCAIYPFLHEHAFSVRWSPAEGVGWRQVFETHSLLELYVFELMEVLRSERRIARCQHCWRYFVPRTKKKTDYCYRVWQDGKTCGVHGANLRRYDGPGEDRYLAAYKRLRARFYERDYRAYTTQRPQRIFEFADWIEDAGEARAAYLEKEIDGEELLRRLNPDGEPLELTAENPKAPESPSFSAPWQSLVEGNINFDPDRHFEDMQVLNLHADEPNWREFSAGERASLSKQGVVSLLEKYRKQQ